MDRGGQEDAIVFPDQHYTSPTAERADEFTTVTNQPKTSNNLTLLVIIICCVCIIGVVGVIILYKRYKKSKDKADKTDCQISLPTLGTQYELHSLLSINTVGRKSSNHSESSNPVSDDIEKCDKSQDVFDGRVSRYIDASTIEMSRAEDYMAEQANYTLKDILDETSEQRLGSSQSFNLEPPRALPENSTSRPMSLADTGGSVQDEMQSISIIGVGDSLSRPISSIEEEGSELSSNSPEIPTNPTVQILPPTPSYPKIVTRPKSENIENQLPLLPAKKKLGTASSELAMNNVPKMPPSPASARSDSHLAIVPPVPPKSKPFLPPKQTINKSKEDVDRINKEILRKSSQTVNGQVQGQHTSQINGGEDIDYDFPARPGDDGEEEYDEPCPVHVQVDDHEQLDYDDPVQKYL